MDVNKCVRNAYIAMSQCLINKDQDFRIMAKHRTIIGGRYLDYFLPEPQIREDGIMVTEFPKKNLRVYTFDLSQGREQYELWLEKLNPEPEIVQAFQEVGLGMFIESFYWEGIANIVTTMPD